MARGRGNARYEMGLLANTGRMYRYTRGILYGVHYRGLKVLNQTQSILSIHNIDISLKPFFFFLS